MVFYWLTIDLIIKNSTPPILKGSSNNWEEDGMAGSQRVCYSSNDSAFTICTYEKSTQRYFLSQAKKAEIVDKPSNNC